MSNTPCKNCIFAEYDDFTQTGCERGMIEKYKSVGSEVMEAYDEDKEFFVIKERICPFFRDGAWLSRFKNPEDKEMVEKIIEFETTPAFHVILFMDDMSIDDLSTTIENLNQQSVKPIQITIIRERGSSIKPRDLTKAVESCTFKWRLENLVIDLGREKIIHMIQKIVKSQYYVVMKAGGVLQDDYFKSIKKMIINDLMQFALIESPEATVVPLPVHQHWYMVGDMEKTISENIKDYQCQNPEKKIVFQYQEIL